MISGNFDRRNLWAGCPAGSRQASCVVDEATNPCGGVDVQDS